MATSDTELEEEVRVMTGYDTAVLPSSQFQTVISRAKSFLINRRSLENDDVDWFGNPRAEEALYWGVCFFAKVKTGELDGQNIAAGAIDLDTLLAKDDNELTTWLRNALNASKSLNPTGDFGIRGSTRTSLDGNRNYERTGGDSGSSII